MRALRTPCLVAAALLFVAGCRLDLKDPGGRDGGRGGGAGPGAVSTIGLELVADELTNPVALVEAPDGSGRLFIVDQVGVIRVVRSDRAVEEPFLDLRDAVVPLMPEFDERGLLGLAFHPDFATNGRVFVYYSAPLRPGAPAGFDHTARLSEFSAQRRSDRLDRASERVLLEIDKPQFNHNGGTLLFGPDGMLYLSVGDGGGADDVGPGHAPEGNGQSVDTLLGKVLRIDVNRGQPYAIPQGNPFAGGGGRPEIFAWGFRNPYRMSFDTGGERSLFVADVGQNLFEEVNIVERGGNYGWNLREGFHCFDPKTPNAAPETCATTGPRGDPLLPPILEYGHAANTPGGLGIAVVGGFVYRGGRLPGLAGRYVFGDYSTTFVAPTGRLFVAGPGADDDAPWRMRELKVAQRESGDLGSFLTGLGRDLSGELYVLTSETGSPTGNTGRVFRMVPEAEGDPDPAPTQHPPGGPAEQVARGEALYAQNCARCHGDKGQGTAQAPALVGPGALPLRPPPEREVRSNEFRTAADIFAFASRYMPADAMGSLPAQTYLDILGFALYANGAALKAPLTAENASEVVVNPRPD